MGRRSVLALVLLWAGPLATLQAQAPAPAARALESFAEVSAKPEADRLAAAKALGAHQDDEVTHVLLRELGRAMEASYRVALLQALGQCVRNGVVETLGRVLEDKDSPYAERSAAANGLGNQGAIGVARLRVVALGSGADAPAANARTYAILALNGVADPQAKAALLEVFRTGTSIDRRNALRGLGKEPDRKDFLDALLQNANDQDLMLAAGCVHELAKRKHPEALARLEPLLKRSNAAIYVAALDDLLGASTRLLRESSYALVLEFVARCESSGGRAFVGAIDDAAKDQGFVAWLRRELAGRESVAELRTGVRVLGRSKGLDKGQDVVQDLLAFARGKDVDVAVVALQAIARRGSKNAAAELRKLVRAKFDARRLEVVLALHAVMPRNAQWAGELLELLDQKDNARDAAVHATLLDLLAELRHGPALPRAWEDFEHAEWEIRAAAYDFARKVRDAGSIPLLIARLDLESGRLREDVLDVLQSLTAMRFHQAARWNAWWEEHGANFVLIPDGAAGPASRSGKADAAATSTYYGIPLVSDKVVFVVDVSGSMAAKVGTDGARSRLDEAKQQLRFVLENIPKQFRFNVVPFDTSVDPILAQMLPALDKTRAEALGKLAALQPRGGTNVHGALQRAFAETEVDTIYLLSDGAPSAGLIQDPTALADEVGRWNRARRIRIHCISIGTDSAMMKRIAKESGGNYTLAR
ncbi:MAG: VWA domain-containing protein [Planctomycetes bacterium]|nr:VWA domain-containing protein [Planctomycetota bacterium]